MTVVTGPIGEAPIISNPDDPVLRWVTQLLPSLQRHANTGALRVPVVTLAVDADGADFTDAPCPLIVRMGPLVVNLRNKRCWLHRSPLRPTPGAYALLALLAQFFPYAAPEKLLVSYLCADAMRPGKAFNSKVTLLRQILDPPDTPPDESFVRLVDDGYALVPPGEPVAQMPLVLEVPMNVV